MPLNNQLPILWSSVPRIYQITQPLAPDDPLILNLVSVWRDARQKYLQFLVDLHTEGEDRNYFSHMLLPHNQVWVAEVDASPRRLPLGFIAFSSGWVNQLYIAPSAQRQGLGQRLLDFAKRHHPTLDLWVFEENPHALRFYQREGFQIIERTDGATNEAHRPDLRLRWLE
ncbi:MAG TPA: GNAT family N-acetyltransferase [Tepidisphaeraceae bacterium]|jgi:GNAT superfamily N-acetyltransferase